MTKQAREAVAVSVNDKLKDAAKKLGVDMNYALRFIQARYVYERVLARLQHTSFADRWVIKGGVLMLALPSQVHRMTMDMDWAQTDGEKLSTTACLAEICKGNPEQEDGLELTIVTEGKDAPRFIREESDHPTVRASIVATLCLPRPNDRRFVVDITQAEQAFEPQMLEWQPTVRGFQPFIISAYPWELVLAEKLHSVMTGSLLNPRLRDYMDVLALSEHAQVDNDLAAPWLERVFRVRGDSEKLSLAGDGLTNDFAVSRQVDWDGTLKRTGYAGHMPASLMEAIEKLRAIAEPLITPKVSREGPPR